MPSSPHQLEIVDGRCCCSVCGQSWKSEPRSECLGVTVYAWGKWPEHLLTKKQMSDAGLQVGKKLPAPSGAVYRDKSPGGVMWLYDKAQGVPKKQISEEARAKLKAAAEKGRQGWYCPQCGQPHYSRGRRYSRALYYWPPRVCQFCEDKQGAVAWARELLAGEFVVLDTETTGLNAGHDEIVQIAVINQAGSVLLDTYVRAQHPERLLESSNGVSASDINGITPDMLIDAPAWPEAYASLIRIVAGRQIVIYNAEFDLAMIYADCQRYGIQAVEMDADCAMLQYAQYVGDYSSYWGNYRWQPLNGGHTALADCQACLSVIHEMAGSREEG